MARISDGTRVAEVAVMKIRPRAFGVLVLGSGLMVGCLLGSTTDIPGDPDGSAGAGDVSVAGKMGTLGGTGLGKGGQGATSGSSGAGGTVEPATVNGGGAGGMKPLLPTPAGGAAGEGGEGGEAGSGGAGGESPGEEPIAGADLVAWNDQTVLVERSLGSKLAAPAYWTQNALFYGSAANLIGDVTGDGRADLVAWNSGDAMYVLKSSGSGFVTTGATWTSQVVAPGKRATALGDVNNDKKLDLIAWNDDNVKVNLSTGSAFGATTAFSTGFPFYGNVANLVGDVTGDGRVDLVAWPNNDDVYVLKSTGTAFVTATGATWTSGIVASGTRANLLGDVDGDKRADLIAWSDDSVKVNLSTGATFASTATWISGHSFYGSKANLVVDMNGDGRADLVAWNADSVQVELSTGTAFSPPTTWISNTPFAGTRANVAAQVQ